ncbi:MAG: hypothetical protein WCP69_00310 [Bacteroidota bacterium]
MDFQTFIKKPIVIGNLLLLVFFVLFPYFTLSMGGFGSVSKTGLGLFFTIFDKFSFLNLLLILVPVACGNMLFQAWKGSNSLVMVSKIVLLVILGYLFLQIAFFAEKSSIKFVGIGLWLSLIMAIAMMFETKITELICPNKPDQNNPVD